MSEQYDIDQALIEFEYCVKKLCAARDEMWGCQYALEAKQRLKDEE